MKDLLNNNKYSHKSETEKKYEVVNKDQDVSSQAEIQPLWVNTE